MHNYWIPVSDLLSGFVVVCLLLFVTAAVKPQVEKMQQKLEEEEKGLSIEDNRTEQFAKLKVKLKEAELANLVYVDPEHRTIELKDVSFQSGSACLSLPAKKVVQAIQTQVLADMQKDHSLNIYLEGHTDPIPVGGLRRSCGIFENNTQLSTLRAANVRDLLIVDNVDFRSRMPVTGWGADRLKNKKDPTNAINRRVALKWIWEKTN